MRHHAAGGAGTDDDVVVFVLEIGELRAWLACASAACSAMSRATAALKPAATSALTEAAPVDAGRHKRHRSIALMVSPREHVASCRWNCRCMGCPPRAAIVSAAAVMQRMLDAPAARPHQLWRNPMGRRTTADELPGRRWAAELYTPCSIGTGRDSRCRSSRPCAAPGTESGSPAPAASRRPACRRRAARVAAAWRRPDRRSRASPDCGANTQALLQTSHCTIHLLPPDATTYEVWPMLWPGVPTAVTPGATSLSHS